MAKNELSLAWFLIFVCIYSLLYNLLCLIAPGEAFRYYIISNANRSHYPFKNVYFQMFNYVYIILMFIKVWHVRRKAL